MLLNTKPPPSAKISHRRKTCSRTSAAVPKGNTLCVSTPPPQKTSLSPKFAFSCSGSIPVAEHCTGFRMSIPALDEGRQELGNRAAGVLEGLPLRVRVNPIGDLFVIGKVKVLECLHRAERGRLRAEVRSADKHCLNAVADGGVNGLKISDGDLALVREDFMDVILAAAGGDIPLGNVADALGMLERWSRNQRDIAECRASEVGDHAAARLAAARTVRTNVVEVRRRNQS